MMKEVSGMKLKSLVSRMRFPKANPMMRTLQLGGFLLVLFALYSFSHSAQQFRAPTLLAAKVGSYYSPPHRSTTVASDLDELARQQLHFSSYKYSGLDKFVSNVSSMHNPSLQDKCSVFFNELTKTQPLWSMQRDFGFNFNALDKLALLKSRVFANPEDGLEWYRHVVRDTVTSANEMADSATIMRVFGKCFLNDDPTRNMTRFREYLRTMLPHLQNAVPEFHFPGSSHALRNSLPLYDAQNALSHRTFSFHNDKTNIVEFMRAHLTGKGIVVNVNPGSELNLLGLLRLLRATNNKYPIQVFHRGNLDEEMRKLAQYHATANRDALLNITYPDHPPQVLPDMDLKQFSESQVFPKQKMWFVDLRSVIMPKFELKIRTLEHMALFYSSFAEVLYMDVNAIPLVSPEQFFTAPEYTQTGAYFFKDRALLDSHLYMISAIVARLLPLTKSSIEPYFGIGRLTTKTMSNPFFQGWNRFADTNIFVFNKEQHFATVVNALILMQWDSTLLQVFPHYSNPYWLSMAISGDESFAYNELAAGAAGRLPTSLLSPLSREHETKRICSSQLAHLSPKNELMWLGPSFHYCRRNKWDTERNEAFYKNIADGDLKKLFDEPTRLEGVIVPPSPPALWEPMLSYSDGALALAQAILKQIRDDRAIDILTSSNHKGSNWFLHGACLGTDYCALERVPSFTSHAGQLQSLSLEFSEDQVDHYVYMGKLWLNLGKPFVVVEEERLAQEQRARDEMARRARERLAKEKKEREEKERKEREENERKEKEEKAKKEKEEQEKKEKEEKARKVKEEREKAIKDAELKKENAEKEKAMKDGAEKEMAMKDGAEIEEDIDSTDDGSIEKAVKDKEGDGDVSRPKNEKLSNGNSKLENDLSDDKEPSPEIEDMNQT